MRWLDGVTDSMDMSLYFWWDYKMLQPLWKMICQFLKKLMEKAMAPHSSTLAWKIPWTEEPGRLQSMGSLESDMTERLHYHFSLSCIGTESDTTEAT